MLRRGKVEVEPDTLHSLPRGERRKLTLSPPREEGKTYAPSTDERGDNFPLREAGKSSPSPQSGERRAENFSLVPREEPRAVPPRRQQTHCRQRPRGHGALDRRKQAAGKGTAAAGGRESDQSEEFVMVSPLRDAPRHHRMNRPRRRGVECDDEVLPRITACCNVGNER
jgi:hypothetical protein